MVSNKKKKKSKAKVIKANEEGGSGDALDKYRVKYGLVGKVGL